MYNHKHLDWILIFSVLVLSLLGCLIIYSTEVYEQGTKWQQQLVMLIIGFTCFMGLSQWRYDWLREFHWLSYALTCCMLILVMFAGVEVNGAQSWLNFAGFNFQPSEFAKLGVIITLSAILHDQDASKLSRIWWVFVIMAIPWVLIVLQPDLGTSLVFGAIAVTMLYWANANLGWILILLSPIISAFLFNILFPVWLIFIALMVLLAIATLPPKTKIWGMVITLFTNFASGKLGSVFWNLLKPYQKDRLTLFLNPEKDPLGGGYHLIQSKIAIGSGRLSGNGFLEGTQTHLNFVPEQHTDFIFSAIADQFGFIGSMIVLVIFWLICWRLVRIAVTAKDNFGSLLAIGVLGMIAFQTIINIAMTVGLAPITGIPLPLITYGRSSLLTNLIAFGLVESVANNRIFPKKRRKKYRYFTKSKSF